MADARFLRFGPVLIVRPLGRGGMGEVFIARASWPNHPLVAIKRLRPDVALLPTLAERFRHEAELCVRLDHVNIVGTLDVGTVEGQLYVASELVFGKDAGVISDRLRERGQGGPAAVAIRLAIDALAGLAYVHGASEADGTRLELVHRDITPGNLLVGYDGVAKLADFGLAKSLLTEGSQLTRHGEILGTPHYLAPELVRGEPATPASDIYGLGSVLYRFLTGIPPHQGTTAELLLKVLQEEPRVLSSLRPDLAPWLSAFVHRMLTKDRKKRPSDAAELLRELTAASRSSALFVPRAAVGRWLESLFQAEYEVEIEERDDLLAIDLQEDTIEQEGTVVLARPSLDTIRLTAPAEYSAEEGEGRGTQVEVHDTELHVENPQHGMSVRPGRGRNGPRSGRAPLLDEPVTALSDNIGFDGTLLTRRPMPMPVDEPARPIPDDPAEARREISPRGGLPGFADVPGSAGAHEETALNGSTYGRPSPHSPLRGADRPYPHEVQGESALWSAGALDRDAVERGAPRRGQPSTTSTDYLPAGGMPPLHPYRPTLEQPGVFRSLASLLFLLTLAVAVGIGIGILVSRLKNAQRSTADQDLRTRWARAERAAEALRPDHGQLSADLVLRMNAVRSALENGRLEEAEIELGRLERMLVEQPSGGKRSGER